MAWHGPLPNDTPPRPPLGRSHPLLGRCAAAGREKRAVPTMHPPKPLSETDLQFASSSRVLSRESTVVPRFCQPGASDAPGRPADPRLFSWPWALRYARYTSESGDLDGGEKIEGHMTAPFWWWPAEFAGCYPLGPASSSRHAVLVLRGKNKHTQARDEWRRDVDAVSPSWECRRRWLPLGEFIHASHLSSSCAARGAMRPASARSTVVSGGVVVVVGINQPWNGCGCVGAGGCMRMRQPQQGEKIGPTPRWGSKGGIPSDLVHLVDDGETQQGGRGWPRGDLGGGVLLGAMGFWTHTTPPMPTTCTPRASTLPLTHVQSHVLHRTICTSADNPRLDGTQYPRTHPPISAYAPPLRPPLPPLPKVPPMRLAHSRCRRSETHGRMGNNAVKLGTPNPSRRSYKMGHSPNSSC